MQHILFITFLLTCFSCTVQNRSFSNYNGKLEPGMPQEPGKCYAKSLMPNIYGIQYDTVLVYTGSDFDRPGIKTEIIEVEPAAERWVKKRAENGFMVWCLEEVPSDMDTFVTVLDTTLIKDYKKDVIETKYLQETGGHTEWQEVICHNDINSNFILSLREALMNQGYQVELGKDKIDNELKKIIKEYQTENQLPIGQLDVETLGKLGVR